MGILRYEYVVLVFVLMCSVYSGLLEPKRSEWGHGFSFFLSL